MVDRPIEEREIEGEPADESNSGPHCCSPPFRAVLGHSPLCLHYTNARGMVACVGAPVVYLSGGVPTRAAAEAFVPRWGREREMFSNQINVESNKWSSQSVLYNAVLATHRLFPFRDYGWLLSGPMCDGRSPKGCDPPH